MYDTCDESALLKTSRVQRYDWLISYLHQLAMMPDAMRTSDKVAKVKLETCAKFCFGYSSYEAETERDVSFSRHVVVRCVRCHWRHYSSAGVNNAEYSWEAKEDEPQASTGARRKVVLV